MLDDAVDMTLVLAALASLQHPSWTAEGFERFASPRTASKCFPNTPVAATAYENGMACALALRFLRTCGVPAN